MPGMKVHETKNFTLVASSTKPTYYIQKCLISVLKRLKQIFKNDLLSFFAGNAQTKCTRSYNVAPHPQSANWNATYAPKLVWISPKTVTLLMPDGTENRFNC